MSDYKQTDYPNVRYAHGPKTIKAIGCYLCCCCNELQALGVDVDPPTLNSWLRYNGGFSGNMVIGTAVARYASGQLGKPVRFRRDITADEALQRDIPVQCSVKNGGHWVTLSAYHRASTSAPVQHIMRDPMARGNYLEQYANWQLGNARCFYIRKATTAGGASTSGPGEASSPAVLLSGISLTADDSLQLSLSFRPDSESALTPVSGSAVEGYEDAETGEVDACQMIEVTDAQEGDYLLQITGQPLAPYSVECNRTTGISDYTIDTFTGTLDGEGMASVWFHHRPTEWECASPVSLSGFQEGDKVSFSNPVSVVVAADCGAWVVPEGGRVPSVRLAGSPSYCVTGNRMRGLAGRVHTALDGKRYLQIEAAPSVLSGSMPGSCYLPTERAASSAETYVTLVGTVTSSAIGSMVLNDSLTVTNAYPQCTFPVSVGDLVSVKGVYSTWTDPNGRLFAGNEPVVVIAQAGLYSSSRPQGRADSARTFSPAGLPMRRLPSNDRVDWALAQPDGTAVVIHGVMVEDVRPDALTVREACAGDPSELLVAGSWPVGRCQTIDVSGFLGTSGSARILLQPRVWAYTDANGRTWQFPLPVKDALGYLVGEWMYRQELEPTR